MATLVIGPQITVFLQRSHSRPSSASRIAIRIRGAVAAVEPDLVRSMRLRPLDEEFRIERNAALGPGVELYHPAVDSIGIQLRVDVAVERVCEIHPLPVPADLDHLRCAAERAALDARMARPRHDAADAHLAGQLGLERIGYVVL